MEEIWKDVKGYEGLYKVSNLGRVLSISRNGTKKTDSLRVPCKGIKYLQLNMSKDGVHKTNKIHTLVAEAFLGYDRGNKNGLVIDHINNNPHDNTLSNLQLISCRENSVKDRVGFSKYIGVSWHKPLLKWRAQAYINKTKIHLGYFNCELSAHLAYNNKVKTI